MFSNQIRAAHFRHASSLRIMRYLGHALIGLCVGAFSVILSGSSARGQNIRITDYDIPVSRADRFDVAASAQIGGYEHYTTSRYRFSGQWESFYNSLPFAWWVNVSGDLGVYKLSGRAARYHEKAAVESDIHKYLRDQGLFFIGAKVGADWKYTYKHVQLWTGWSVGLGRFVDATALAKALRIEQFLQQEKVLAGHLPKETMLVLASIIDREREYKKRYGETYWVRWYADMEKAVIASGLVSGDTIGAVGVYRMREVIERETVRPRTHGWKVEVGEGSYFSRAMESGHMSTWPFFSGTFSWPLGLCGQFAASGRLSGRVDEQFGELFSIRGSFSFVYELSNRIDLLVTETYWNKHYESDHLQYDRHTRRLNETALAFLFYLENQLTVKLEARLEHFNEKFSNSMDSGITESRDAYREWEINASVGYRIF